MKTLVLIFSLISVFAAILNIKKLSICFIVWTFANLGQIFVILFYRATDFYGQLPLWIVFSALNIYGYLEWRNMSLPVRLCKFGKHSWITVIIKDSDRKKITKTCRYCPKEK